MFPCYLSQKCISRHALPDIFHIMTIIIEPVCLFFLRGVVVVVFFGCCWIELRFCFSFTIGTRGEAWTLQCPQEYHICIQPAVHSICCQNSLSRAMRRGWALSASWQESCWPKQGTAAEWSLPKEYSSLLSTFK